MTDKRLLHIINASTLAVLLVCMLLPGEYSGRIAAAAVLLPLCVATCLLIRKRGVLSLNRGQVLLIMTVMGALYLVLYYMTGIELGFVSNIYGPRLDVVMRFALPAALIIVTSELMRSVIIAQESRLSSVLCFFFCVIAEVLIYYDVTEVYFFSGFMDLIGIVFFPAIASGLLYHYLSRRYGAAPNIVYRLITTLYYYLIPYLPGMADSLFAFANLIVPVLIYVFIDALYEKKRRYALGKKGKLSTVLTVAAVAFMAAVVMLISNQFGYGALVIATDSMTGELNKGDVCIFEDYEGQIITEGQVIVFAKGDVSVVHRVIKIERINGANRYYTKGDLNEDTDPGFVSDANIQGVAAAKLPYVGYPTLWVREIVGKILN